MRIRLRSGLVVSPPHGGAVVVYRPDGSQPLRLLRQEWEFLTSLDRSLIPPGEEEERLYQALREAMLAQQPRRDEPTHLQAYLFSLQERGVLELRDADSAAQQVTTDLSEAPRGSEGSEINGTRGLRLFRWKPQWSPERRRFPLALWRSQSHIVLPALLVLLAYLLSFLLAPAPAAWQLLGLDGGTQEGRPPALLRLAIGLLSVNLFSSLVSLWAQGLLDRGDGWLYLRLRYGFIPRFGLKPYWAAKDPEPPPLRDALMLMGQPLLVRLYLIASMVILHWSGRLHGGSSGGLPNTVAATILQVSLFSLTILLIPFWMSPGYRILTSLSIFPANTLPRSVRRLSAWIMALAAWLRRPTPKNRHALGMAMKAPEARLQLAFAGVFLTLLLAKLSIIIFAVIPRMATALPPLFAQASSLIFSVLMLILLLRFLRARVGGIRQSQSFTSSELAKVPATAPPPPSSSSARAGFPWRLLAIALGVILLAVPVPRIVSGSVLVQSSSALNIRAPQDVQVERVFVIGPSSQIIRRGTQLLQLSSPRLQDEALALRSELADLQLQLQNAETALARDQRELRGYQTKLGTAEASRGILQRQLGVYERLVEQGVMSATQRDSIALQLLSLENQIHDLNQADDRTRASIRQGRDSISSLRQQRRLLGERQRQLEAQLEELKLVMPFDGVLLTSTSGLQDTRFSSGETILELRHAAPESVEVLIPDHDRALVKPGQACQVRLYAEPFQPIDAEVVSVNPSAEQHEERLFFRAKLQLDRHLRPELLDSSGAVRINTGRTPLGVQLSSALVRFLRVDLWSWLP